MCSYMHDIKPPTFHVFRWLLDPSALLYDPALKKLVHTITRKVFAQLLNEFKRLGAVVIYADLRRIGEF